MLYILSKAAPKLCRMISLKLSQTMMMTPGRRWTKIPCLGLIISSPRALAEDLRETYRPDAEALCSGIIDALESAAEGYLDSPEHSLNSLAFVARVADELSSSSPFLSSIACRANVAEGLHILCDRVKLMSITHLIRFSHQMCCPQRPHHE